MLEEIIEVAKKQQIIEEEMSAIEARVERLEAFYHRMYNLLKEASDISIKPELDVQAYGLALYYHIWIDNKVRPLLREIEDGSSQIPNQLR